MYKTVKFNHVVCFLLVCFLARLAPRPSRPRARAPAGPRRQRLVSKRRACQLPTRTPSTKSFLPEPTLVAGLTARLRQLEYGVLAGIAALWWAKFACGKILVDALAIVAACKGCILFAATN